MLQPEAVIIESQPHGLAQQREQGDVVEQAQNVVAVGKLQCKVAQVGAETRDQQKQQQRNAERGIANRNPAANKVVLSRVRRVGFLSNSGPVQHLVRVLSQDEGGNDLEIARGNSSTNVILSAAK